MSSRAVKIASLLLAAGVGVSSAHCGDSRGRAMPYRLDTGLGPSRPLVEAAFAGESFLVAWSSENIVRLAEPAENPRVRIVTDLPYVRGFLGGDEEALLLSRDRFVRIPSDGSPPTGPIDLESPPPGILWTFFRLGEKLGIAVAEPGQSDEAGRIHLQIHRLDGRRHGERITLRARGGGLEQPAAVALENGRVFLFWGEWGGDHRGIYGAVLDPASAEVVAGPDLLYRPEPGGAIECCGGASAVGGEAFVVWQDSSEGAWEIMAARVDARGIAAEVSRVSAADGRDDLRPVTAFAGGRLLVAWVGGIHWGVLARTGRGHALTAALNDSFAAPIRWDATGSVERVALAGRGERAGVAAVVREAGAYGIWATGAESWDVDR